MSTPWSRVETKLILLNSACAGVGGKGHKGPGHTFRLVVLKRKAGSNKATCLFSSVASPICQEGQSERTFPIFAFSSRYFLFFPIFHEFSPSFSRFSANFSLSRGQSVPLDPQWLRHCAFHKGPDIFTILEHLFLIFEDKLSRSSWSYRARRGWFRATVLAL